MDEDRIGQLLIDNKFLTPEQLEAALIKQESMEEYKPLGDILIEDGVITRRAFNVVLHVQTIKRDREETSAPRQNKKPAKPVSADGVEKKLTGLDRRMKDMHKSVTESHKEVKKMLRQIIRIVPKKR